MENATFETVSRVLDSRIYSGGLHFLVGVTGSGKSSVCEILEKNNKSGAKFFDVQTDISDKCYEKLANDIQEINTPIVVDGVVLGTDAGSKVFDALLHHSRVKKLGVLILHQSLNDMTNKHFNSADSVALIANLYPRVKGTVYLHSTPVGVDMSDHYADLVRFWREFSH